MKLFKKNCYLSDHYTFEYGMLSAGISGNIMGHIMAWRFNM